MRALALALALLFLGAGPIGGALDRNPFTSIVRVLTTSTAPMPAQVEGDLLQFTDGSAMHGELQAIDPATGLRWRHRDAKYPIDLRPSHIDFIRFPHANAMALSPTCHVRFANGDDLFGSVLSLDTSNLEFKTWFGGTLKIARSALATITFLSRNYSILYEGPSDPGGWVIGNNGPQSWSYRDGSFVTQAAGVLGRDFKLSGSSTIEFDLSSSGFFELWVDLYSQMLDNFGSEHGSYLVGLSTNRISLQRARSGAPVANLGDAAAPASMAGRTKNHITIHCNKEQGTVTILVNESLVKQWKDSNGFSGTGTGILFENHLNVSTLKLSNFKVSHWEGRFEPQIESGPSPTIDSVSFLNQDRAEGKIEAIQGAKLALALGTNLVQVPMERITQIDFARPSASSEPPGPWQVRASFPGGGSVSFQLRKWDDKTVLGQSRVFGALAFEPQAICELEFNLDQPRKALSSPENDFEELDDN